MSVLFEACVKKGGRVRTRSLPDDRFQRLCIIGTNTFYGEIKTKKKK